MKFTFHKETTQHPVMDYLRDLEMKVQNLREERIRRHTRTFVFGFLAGAAIVYLIWKLYAK